MINIRIALLYENFKTIDFTHLNTFLHQNLPHFPIYWVCHQRIVTRECSECENTNLQGHVFYILRVKISTSGNPSMLTSVLGTDILFFTLCQPQYPVLTYAAIHSICSLMSSFKPIIILLCHVWRRSCELSVLIPIYNMPEVLMPLRLVKSKLFFRIYV